jgi:hypothetical protein
VTPDDEVAMLRGQLSRVTAIERAAVALQIIPEWPGLPQHLELPDLNYRVGGLEWTCRPCSTELLRRLEADAFAQRSPTDLEQVENAQGRRTRSRRDLENGSEPASA